MKILSRTPEDMPLYCPLCAAPVVLSMKPVAEEACCPECGCRIEGAKLLLAFWVRERTAIELSLSRPVTLETRLSELASDSLAVVELVMLLEEQLTVRIADTDYELLSQSQTVRELLSRLSHSVEAEGD